MGEHLSYERQVSNKRVCSVVSAYKKLKKEEFHVAYHLTV